MWAIQQHELGGPEVLCYEQVPEPTPGEGQVRIAVEAAGVHLVDTSIRAGANFGPFPAPELPMIPGREVAGTVDQVGSGADRAWLGRRIVVHLGPASGGYASLAIADIDALFALPDHVNTAAAVAMVGTGRTALGILEVAEPTPDDVVVVTAAAGGIGALLVQAAHRAGTRVVATAGTEAKAQVAADRGANAVATYADADWTDQVRKALDGRDVTVVLDGIGGSVGRGGFELVAPGGRMVMFGYASGEEMPLSTSDLYASGVTVSAAVGPRMMQRPGGIRALAEQALDELAAGRLTPLLNPPFPLSQAADAHRALESRETIGKVVLIP